MTGRSENYDQRGPSNGHLVSSVLHQNKAQRALESLERRHG